MIIAASPWTSCLTPAYTAEMAKQQQAKLLLEKEVQGLALKMEEELYLSTRK